MPAKKSKFEKLLEYVSKGKHNLALRELRNVKRRLTEVKRVDMDYGIGDKEKFVQVTVPGEGKYLLWAVVKKEGKVKHRFYLKEATKKTKGERTYNIISWRVPVELRGSKIRLKILKLEE